MGRMPHRWRSRGCCVPRLLLVTLLFAAACGDDGGTTDAGSFGADGAFGAEGGIAALVAPPVIPWYEPATGEGAPGVAPPSFRPCPEGFHERTTDTGLDVCDPFPAGGPSVCPADSAHFLGDPGCTPIGAPCPAGDFPEGLPASSAVIHVLAGAAAGGDGSRARPFATIGEATSRASAGTIVAIGKGRYDELVAVPGGVTLWGACVAETVITQSAGVAPGFPGGVITVSEPGAVVRNLQLSDGELIGVWVSGPGALELEGFLMTSCRTQGIFAYSGGAITARDVVVRDMRPRARDMSGGNAFGAENGSLDLSRVLVERASYGGIVAGVGDVRARDVVVRGIAPDLAEGIGGYGIVVGGGGSLDVERALVENAHGLGIAAQGLGTTLRVANAVVRGIAADTVGAVGVGLTLGATGTVTELLVEQSQGEGLSVNSDSVLVAGDVVVRELVATDEGSPGIGIYGGAGAAGGPSLTIDRAVVERAEIGVGLEGAGGVATLTDVHVRDTRRPPDAVSGGAPALGVIDAEMTLRRGIIERTYANAVEATGSARMILQDVSISDARSNPMGYGFGIGLLGSNGGTVEASRVVIRRVEGSDVLLTEGSSGRLVDVVLRDGRPIPDTLLLGNATLIQVSSSLELERVEIDDHLGFSMLAVELATIRGRDVKIRATRPYACSATTCADEAAGTAVLGVGFAIVELERFIVDDAALCGVMVARSSSLDLSVGEVRGAEIGACVQIAGYDLDRLSDRVVYADNGQNLQSTSLPVPDVIDLPSSP